MVFIACSKVRLLLYSSKLSCPELMTPVARRFSEHPHIVLLRKYFTFLYSNIVVFSKVNEFGVCNLPTT